MLTAEKIAELRAEAEHDRVYGSRNAICSIADFLALLDEVEALRACCTKCEWPDDICQFRRALSSPEGTK